jgi:2-haloacid dehalogenase
MPRFVLDLVGTVFGLDPLRQRLTAIGAPEHALESWLAEAERDQLALALAGDWAPLEAVLEASLPRVLAASPKASRDPARQALVLKGLSVLNPLDGVQGALAQLAASGFELQTLSLTSEPVAAALLERAGLRAHFTALHAGPLPGMLRSLGEGGETWLCTARGSLLPLARASGLRTVWISRRERALSAALPAPDLVAADLTGLAQRLAGPSAETALASPAPHVAPAA